MRVISYLSYLSSSSFWKGEALKTYQQNAAIYHHQAEWNEQKMLLCKNANNLSNKELNNLILIIVQGHNYCVLEQPRMATYDFCLGTFIGMYP